MNPVLTAALWSVIRHLMTLLAGYLVAHGVWAHEDSQRYVPELTAAVVMGLTAVGAAIYNKYKQKRLVNTALAMPSGATVEETRKVIAEGKAAPATLLETSSPRLNKSVADRASDNVYSTRVMPADWDPRNTSRESRSIEDVMAPEDLAKLKTEGDK